MNEVITMADLVDEWEDLNNHKNRYAFGDELFDRTEFTDLIRKTLDELKSFKEELLGNDFSVGLLDPLKNITPYDIMMYSSLTTEIAKYSTDILTDESEDYIFTASLIVTRFLLLYANDFLDPIDNKGILGGRAEFADIYQSDEDEDFEFWNRSFHFDTNIGDYTAVLELAQRYNQSFVYSVAEENDNNKM